MTKRLTNDMPVELIVEHRDRWPTDTLVWNVADQLLATMQDNEHLRREARDAYLEGFNDGKEAVANEMEGGFECLEIL
jgi:hypothetical protein